MLRSSQSEFILADGPRVSWLDATERGLDADELRQRAREICSAAAERYSSRSYSYPYALAALHVSAVGVDIERVTTLDVAFAASICTPAEAVELSSGEAGDRYVTSLWSSKEALSKALGDALSYDPRRLESPRAWVGGKAGPWRASEVPVGPDHVAWVCWRATPPLTRSVAPTLRAAPRLRAGARLRSVPRR